MEQNLFSILIKGSPIVTFLLPFLNRSLPPAFVGPQPIHFTHTFCTSNKYIVGIDRSFISICGAKSARQLLLSGRHPKNNVYAQGENHEHLNYPY